MDNSYVMGSDYNIKSIRGYKMVITVNEIPPSNNQFIGNSKNFNEYRREKERWHWLIKAAIRERPDRKSRGTYYILL